MVQILLVHQKRFFLEDFSKVSIWKTLLEFQELEGEEMSAFK